MDSLAKKLTQLSELLKAMKKPEANKPMHSLPTLPSIKPPPPPSMTPTKSTAPKIGIGTGPSAKKDPKKVAQQIRDGSMSTKTQKVMLKAQWSDADLEKADASAGQALYHIHKDGHRITSKPLSVAEIEKQHGGIKRLENSGFRLHAHQPITFKADADTWGSEPTDPSNI